MFHLSEAFLRHLPLSFSSLFTEGMAQYRLLFSLSSLFFLPKTYSPQRHYSSLHVTYITYQEYKCTILLWLHNMTFQHWQRTHYMLRAYIYLFYVIISMATTAEDSYGLLLPRHIFYFEIHNRKIFFFVALVITSYFFRYQCVVEPPEAQRTQS